MKTGFFAALLVVFTLGLASARDTPSFYQHDTRLMDCCVCQCQCIQDKPTVHERSAITGAVSGMITGGVAGYLTCGAGCAFAGAVYGGEAGKRAGRSTASMRTAAFGGLMEGLKVAVALYPLKKPQLLGIKQD